MKNTEQKMKPNPSQNFQRKFNKQKLINILNQIIHTSLIA